MAGVCELVKEVQATANGVIKNATLTVDESSFKKFAEFCLANGYPDPHTERHMNFQQCWSRIFRAFLHPVLYRYRWQRWQGRLLLVTTTPTKTASVATGVILLLPQSLDIYARVQL
jgi:hypothetical protein